MLINLPRDSSSLRVWGVPDVPGLLMQSKRIFNVLVDKVVYEPFLYTLWLYEKCNKGDDKNSWQGYDKGTTRLRMMAKIQDPKVQGYQIEPP